MNLHEMQRKVLDILGFTNPKELIQRIDIKITTDGLPTMVVTHALEPQQFVDIISQFAEHFKFVPKTPSLEETTLAEIVRELECSPQGIITPMPLFDVTTLGSPYPEYVGGSGCTGGGWASDDVAATPAPSACPPTSVAPADSPSAAPTRPPAVQRDDADWWKLCGYNGG